MKKNKSTTYYVVTRDGVPVIYGDKLHLFLKKRDASPLKGDMVEKMQLTQVKKSSAARKTAYT